MWTYVDIAGNQFIKGSLPWDLFTREGNILMSSSGMTMELEYMIGPHEELIEIWGNIK